MQGESLVSSWLWEHWSKDGGNAGTAVTGSGGAGQSSPLVVVAGVHGMAEGGCDGGGAGDPGAARGRWTWCPCWLC